MILGIQAERNLCWREIGTKDSLPDALCPCVSDLQGVYIFGGGPFGRFFDFESDPLTFAEGLEPGSLDCGKVDKNVLAAVLLNESVALLLIEPLYSSFRHRVRLLSLRISMLFGQEASRIKKTIGSGHHFDRSSPMVSSIH